MPPILQFKTMGEPSFDDITHQIDDFYFSSLSHGDEVHDRIPISDESYAEEILNADQNYLIPNADQNYAMDRNSRGTHDLIPNADQNYTMDRDSLSSSQARLFCKICMDDVPVDRAFKVSNACLHVFCLDCLIRYLGTKIQENISDVKCPEENCKAILEPEMCRELLPSAVFERWEMALCESMLLGLQKIYCPFKDCSELMVDDGDRTTHKTVTRAECPSCHRLFCAACKVAWHSDLSCEEVDKLGDDERGHDDILLMQVAKKENWRRCSNCKYFVEKIDGCLHIICRCTFEFCYRCGNKWSTCQSTCPS